MADENLFFRIWEVIKETDKFIDEKFDIIMITLMTIVILMITVWFFKGIK